MMKMKRNQEHKQLSNKMNYHIERTPACSTTLAPRCHTEGPTDIAHHVSKRVVDPSFLRHIASDDVASNIWQALATVGCGYSLGPGGHCLPRHPTHFGPSSLELNGTYDVASDICQALATLFLLTPWVGGFLTGNHGSLVPGLLAK
jgi:hypothetical protein